MRGSKAKIVGVGEDEGEREGEGEVVGVRESR